MMFPSINNFFSSELYNLIFAIIAFIVLRASTMYVFPELETHSLKVDLFVLILIIIGYNLTCEKNSLIEHFEVERSVVPVDAVKASDEDYLNPADPILKEKRKQENISAKKIKESQKYEMKYDEGNPLNTVPLAENPYKNDYTYLPPSNWMRPFERPPVCITEKRCPVCPGLTTGTDMQLLEYENGPETTRPEMKINNDYINNQK